jgi:hypothetical protein
MKVRNLNKIEDGWEKSNTKCVWRQSPLPSQSFRRFFSIVYRLTSLMVLLTLRLVNPLVYRNPVWLCAYENGMARTEIANRWNDLQIWRKYTNIIIIWPTSWTSVPNLLRSSILVLLESCLHTCMTYTRAECTVNKLLMMGRGTAQKNVEFHAGVNLGNWCIWLVLIYRYLLRCTVTWT